MADVKLDLEQIPVSPIADYEDLFLLRRKVLGADRTVTKADLLESLKFMVTLNDAPDFIGQIGLLKGTFYISVAKTGINKWKSILASADSNLFFEIITNVDIPAFKVIVSINEEANVADNTNLQHVNKVVGIAYEDGLAGFPIKVQSTGSLENVDWVWDVNKPIFFDLSGNLSQTVPTTGFLQQVAVPLTTNKISISLQRPVIL